MHSSYSKYVSCQSFFPLINISVVCIKINKNCFKLNISESPSQHWDGYLRETIVCRVVQERTRISMMWSRSLRSERQSCRVFEVQLEKFLRPSSPVPEAALLPRGAGNARTEMSDESYMDVSMSSKMSSSARSVR